VVITIQIKVLKTLANVFLMEITQNVRKCLKHC